MDALEHVRTLAQAGQRAAAKSACQDFVAQHPDSESGLMQLLVLDPTPLEEVAVLEALLHYFPTHRFAAKFEERLSSMRLVVQLTEMVPDLEVGAASGPALTQRGRQRIGDFLVAQGLITQSQLESATYEQARLHEGAQPQRLGTVLIRQGALTPQQLADALSQQIRTGSGELGDFLVERGVLTAEQLRQALERQALAASETEQRYQEALADMARQQSAQWDRGLLQRPTKSLSPPKREALPRIGQMLVELGFLTDAEIEHWLQERDRAFHGTLR